MPDSGQTMPGADADDVVRELTSLSQHIVPDRRAHLQSLADALQDPASGEGSAWAGVDLFEAFEPDTTVLERTNIWRVASVYALFLPLLVTWLGLAGAVAHYNSLPAEERAQRSFFEVWVSGVDFTFLGMPFRNSLGVLALLVAIVVLIAIIAGIAADRYNKQLDQHRNDLRAALTSASRLLNQRYPQSSADAADALVTFAARLDSVAAGLTSLVNEVAASTQGSIAAIVQQSKQGSEELSAANLEALGRHAQVTEQMEVAVARATEGLQQAALAAQSIAASTELDQRRREEYDRIASHMADTAADLRMQLESLPPKPPHSGQMASGPSDGTGKQ